ncbi:hypothetical protein A6M21_16310 [Desulfotomaculum copahuensis]|uniref:Uncharacterized protein n=1 Tax=Desulfotomaculum copahuensis TaxID=1838280 RepID=A0A1B7LAF1_9FIRM|nr:hypothetical protein A6M21_16310 [Desulfotomaculum copahuensis]
MINGNLPSLIRFLIQETLKMLQNFISEGRQVQDQRMLITMQLCEQDNYQSTPSEMRYAASLLPLVFSELEKKPQFQHYCKILLENRQFSAIFPAKDTMQKAYPMSWLVIQYFDVLKNVRTCWN